jgi:carbonic anhydrase
VIRNAGGRASDDAIRSLVISYKLLGTREFFVIHHTDCGMQFFSNEGMRGLLASSLETAELTPQGFRDVGKGSGSRAGEYIEWLTIKDPKQAVLDDMARIRSHPLIPRSIPVYGYIYDVKSGSCWRLKGPGHSGQLRVEKDADPVVRFQHFGAGWTRGSMPAADRSARLIRLTSNEEIFHGIMAT